jgi:hypothetical protein
MRPSYRTPTHVATTQRHSSDTSQSGTRQLIGARGRAEQHPDSRCLRLLKRDSRPPARPASMSPVDILRSAPGPLLLEANSLPGRQGHRRHDHPFLRDAGQAAQEEERALRRRARVTAPLRCLLPSHPCSTAAQAQELRIAERYRNAVCFCQPVDLHRNPNGLGVQKPGQSNR